MDLLCSHHLSSKEISNYRIILEFVVQLLLLAVFYNTFPFQVGHLKGKLLLRSIQFVTHFVAELFEEFKSVVLLIVRE